MVKILLTSAGFENPNIERSFLELIPRKPEESKAIWVPTAAIDDEAKAFLPKCWNDLIHAGFRKENITTFNCDRTLTFSELKQYDVIYFCGGSPEHLLSKIHEIQLESSLWRFIQNGGVYVGVSAGSWIAVDNIKGNLGYANCTIAVHQPIGTPAGPIDITTHPHITLTNLQAILRIDDTYSVIE